MFRQSCWSRDRQFHGEDCASVRMIGRRDPATMLLHDSISQRKTQSDTLPHVLCRVERLEDAWKRVIAQAWPVVPKRHNRPAFLAPVLRGDLDAPVRVGRANR